MDLVQIDRGAAVLRLLHIVARLNEQLGFALAGCGDLGRFDAQSDQFLSHRVRPAFGKPLVVLRRTDRVGVSNYDDACRAEFLGGCCCISNHALCFDG